MGRHKEYSEQAFRLCITLITFSTFLLIVTGKHLPNIPKSINTESNQPSYVKAESVISSSVPIRQSLGIFIVTAYCPNECCCGDYADGITASGHKIQKGDKFCATDPRITFHLKLDIEEYGIVQIEDRGGKIKGNKIDVFFWTHEEALEWKGDIPIHIPVPSRPLYNQQRQGLHQTTPHYPHSLTLTY